MLTKMAVIVWLYAFLWHVNEFKYLMTFYDSYDYSYDRFW